MARWIAFDQETTSLLRSMLGRGTKIETLLRGPVDYALARPGSVVAVLPATGSGNPGIAVFRRTRPAVASAQHPVMTQPTANRSNSRAGGFLGLSDEAAFEEEASQEKKGWWRKIWDE